MHQRRGLQWWDGSECTSLPQREGPCSWAADESWLADRRPFATGRCYCVWELYTTEESLPLTNVSFRAPCTAWHCSVYIHYSISDSAAELNHMHVDGMSVSMRPCGSNMSFFSPFMGLYASSLFSMLPSVCFLSGFYCSAGGIRSMSSDFTWFLNTMGLCSQSGYIKTVNIVVQKNVLCLHIYEPELPKGNMQWVYTVTKGGDTVVHFLWHKTP